MNTIFYNGVSRNEATDQKNYIQTVIHTNEGFFSRRQEGKSKGVHVQSGFNRTIQYIKIQPKTIDLSRRLWGIISEFVGFIPQSQALRSVVT